MDKSESTFLGRAGMRMPMQVIAAPRVTAVLPLVLHRPNSFSPTRDTRVAAGEAALVSGSGVASPA